MRNPIYFDIQAVSKQVYSAGAAVEALARHFLAARSYSPQFLSASTNEDARRAMHSVLQLMNVFNENSSCSDQERQRAYLQFVTTLSDLAKGAGPFAKELRARNLMDFVCNTLGEIIYQRPSLATEIRDHVDAHVKIMQASWFSGAPQFSPNQSQRL